MVNHAFKLGLVPVYATTERQAEETIAADGAVQLVHHCHLNYRYVACWTCRRNEIVIEVYYVGSREKAPY